MIRSFKHKGLAELFEQGRSRRVRQDLQARCLERLDALDQAQTLQDIDRPGFNFHSLQGLPRRLACTSTDRSVSPSSGKTMMHCESTWNSIIEERTWLSTR